MNDSVEMLGQRIDAIDVPQFDFAAIKARAVRKPARAHRRRTIVTVTLLILLPALAAAAAHFIPLQVKHRFGNWQLWGPSRTFTHPSAADFSKLAREAPYHVVWPAGVPADHKLLFLGAMGSEVFTMVYTCPVKDVSYNSTSIVIIPKNFQAVSPKLGKWFESQVASDRTNASWNVGSERVALTTDCLTSQQIQNIRDAMTVSSGMHGR